MFAIISSKKNQYLVTEGKEYDIDLLNEKDQKTVIFSEVLLFSDGDKTLVGQPTIEGATVEAEILGEKRLPKTTVLKFHSKKRYQRKIGSRQEVSRIKIIKINVKDKK